MAQAGFAPAPETAKEKPAPQQVQGFTPAPEANDPGTPTPQDLTRLADTGASPRLVEMVKSGEAQIPERILHPPGVSTEPPKTWGQAAWQTGKNIVSGMATMASKGLRSITPAGAQENAQEATAAVEAEKQRMAERRSGPNPYNPVYRALAPVTDLVPVFPVSAAQMEESAKRGDMKQLATDTGAAVAMTTAPYWSGPVKEGVKAVARPLVREVGRATDVMTPQFVKDYTQPEAGAAVTKAVQPGANIPRFEQSKDIVGPRIQQLKQDGLLTDAQGQPLSEIRTPDDLLAATKAVKSHIWDHVEQRLGPVDDHMADTTPIAAAMKATITDRTRQQYPQMAAAIEKRADTYLTPRPLRSIEEGIQDANNDLRNYYKRPMPTDSPIGPDTAATEAEVSAARALLDEKVNDLRGAGVADLKREYGAARDMERAAARAKIVADRQKGMPLYEGLAMLRAAGEAVSGNVLGAAKSGMTLAMGRYLTKLRSPNFLIDQAFQGTNAFQAAPAIQSLGPHLPTPVRGAPWTGPGMDIAAPAQPAPGPARGADWTGPGMDLATREPAPPAQGQLSGQQKQLPASHIPPSAAGTADRTSAHGNPAQAAAMAGVDYPKPAKALRPEDKLLTGPGGTAEGPGNAPPTQTPPKPGQPQGRNGATPAKPLQGRATPAKTAASPVNRPAGAAAPVAAEPSQPTPAKPMVNGRLTLNSIASMTDPDALEQIITDRTKSKAMQDAAYSRRRQLWASQQPKPEAPPPSAEPPLEKVTKSEDPEYLKYIAANGQLSQPLRDAATSRIQELETTRKALLQKHDLSATARAARETIAAGKGEENPAAEPQPAQPLQRKAPVKERYPADLVAHAEGQMKGALDLATSFDRPGRYMDVYKTQGVGEAFNAGEDYNFRGVKSSAHHVEGQFPWYKGEGMSITSLKEALSKGKGAAYERIMQRIIDMEEPDYRANQQQQAAPIADVSKPDEKPTEAPAAQAEPAGVLPGMGKHVEAQKAGAAKVQGEQMTAELQKPLGSIESKAGDMERNSPLFRGTEASPQKEIFGKEPPKKPPKLKR